jgi:RNA polymerase primary sigma factor
MKRVGMARRGDSAAMESYLRDLAEMPELGDGEDAALAERAAAGDIGAREQLVKGHLRMVVRIARQYERFGLPLADLVAEGNLGLLRAGELFEPKFGLRFSTYASFWIKQRMQRAITSQARSVRIPVWKSQRLRKLARLHDDLNAELGRDATARELAARLGIPEQDLASIEGDRIEVASLDAPVGEGEQSLAGMLKDDSHTHPSEGMARAELVDEIIDCLHDLDDRELGILSLKFGLDGGDEESFREMSRRFGLSREWVRQIADGAMAKIKKALSVARRDPGAAARRQSVKDRIRRLAAARRERGK